jgi:uncharacterized protein
LLHPFIILMGIEMSLDFETLIIAGLLLLAAVLYSSVGHGGASGYIAAMSLLGVAPAVMKPTALALNLVVASIAVFKFYRTGSFSWRLFIPLAATAIPMAYLGGAISLPVHWYKPLVGVVLIYAAWRSLRTASSASSYELQVVAPWVLCAVGAALGLLSGLTGVGGGIFLSPLLLFFRWAPVKVISGVAAAFILVNSAAGILGVMSTNIEFHSGLPLWALVVMIGGLIGAEYGSKRLANPIIQRLLALVLLVAGLKMFLTFFTA